MEVETKMGISIMEYPTLLVAFAVAMVMGVYVIAKIQPTINGLTGVANTTVTSVFTTTYNAFALLVVSLIVLGERMQKISCSSLNSCYHGYN